MNNTLGRLLGTFQSRPEESKRGFWCLDLDFSERLDLKAACLFKVCNDRFTREQGPQRCKSPYLVFFREMFENTRIDQQLTMAGRIFFLDQHTSFSHLTLLLLFQHRRNICTTFIRPIKMCPFTCHDETSLPKSIFRLRFTDFHRKKKITSL